MKSIGRSNGKAAGRNGQELIENLINDLASRDKSVRAMAGKSLTAMEAAAAGALVKALSNPNDKVRWEAGRLLDEMNIDWTKHADDETIKSLITDLGNKDGIVRVRARRALVAIGAKTVDSLAAAIKSKQDMCRWESVKALSQIRDADSIGILIKSLEDNVFEIRYLASEGLIAIGRPALEPLLRALAASPDSRWLREGVHRIFHGIEGEDIIAVLKPVLNALEDSDAQLKVPFAAGAALDQLRKMKTSNSRQPVRSA